MCPPVGLLLPAPVRMPVDEVRPQRDPDEVVTGGWAGIEVPQAQRPFEVPGRTRGHFT